MLRAKALPVLLRRQQVPVWLRGVCFTAGILTGLSVAFVILVIAGLVIGGIYTAGGTLKVFYSLSEAIVILIEGVILLCLLISKFFASYQIHIPKATNDTCETPL